MPRTNIWTWFWIFANMDMNLFIFLAFLCALTRFLLIYIKNDHLRKWGNQPGAQSFFNTSRVPLSQYLHNEMFPNKKFWESVRKTQYIGKIVQVSQKIWNTRKRSVLPWRAWWTYTNIEGVMDQQLLETKLELLASTELEKREQYSNLLPLQSWKLEYTQCPGSLCEIFKTQWLWENSTTFDPTHPPNVCFQILQY